MEETIKELRNRKRNIKQATEVNRQHADMMKAQSEARARRSKIQIKAEVLENKNIDYRKHMKWLN